VDLDVRDAETRASTPAKGRRVGGVAPRAGTRRGVRVPAPESLAVVHLAAEYWPLARTGGLGEAVSGLAAYQARAGQPTTVVMPLYRSVRDTAPDLERVGPAFTVPVGPRIEEAWLYRVRGPENGARVFLIEHPEFFDRSGIYGVDGSDYPDNARRFAFFSMAALLALPRIAPDAQVLHAHDWHTALAPVYLRTRFAGEPLYSRLSTILSVHNAGFQGHFAPETMADLGLPMELFNPDVLEWYGRLNFLKGGLAFSDVAVTVSPTHARELRTPEGGFGLHEMFAAMGDRLVGILNGIDEEQWNPATDEALVARYSVRALSGKRLCKAALQRAYGLPERPHAPLFGMSARLVAQKGIDLILGADLLATPDAQFVFLGAGEGRYHALLADLAAAAPDRVAVEFAFTDVLEHRLLGGVDALLMPSLYEPCGLTQLRAQRYGAIPVARGVGGLVDSIRDGETGFLFDEYSPAALSHAVQRAVGGYAQRATWRTMMRRAMAQRFGWEHAAAQYLDVYRRALTARSIAA
jgi:starch synthase